MANADLKQPDRAIADFTQAIKLDHTFANAFFNRGVVESDDKNQLDKAIADFRRAWLLLRLDACSPDELPPFLDLAFVEGTKRFRRS
jgi:tetratricopeptide (TPR) repeat protein